MAVEKMGSLFAGVGGFELAGKNAGLDAVFTSEYDAACNRVLDVQFPSTAHLGDITQIDGDLLPHVDVLTAGSPCQDFSIAGMRRGLEGARSGLFAHFVRLIDEVGPRFAVWENVPGALTSSNGGDFANVLGALVGSPVPLPLPKHPNGRRSRYAGVASGPKGTLAWRVLDAQHFGVAQRRQRIFAVLDREGGAAPAVMFPGIGDVHLGKRPVVVRGESWVMPLDYDDLPFDTGMAPPETTKIRLAEVLEEDAGERFYLSEKACLGILERSGRRGKALPAVLDYALRVQAGLEVGERPATPAVGNPVAMKIRAGKPGGGKGALLSEDLSLTIATGNDQYLFEPQTFGKVHRASSPTDAETWAERDVSSTITEGDQRDKRAQDVIVEQPHYRVRRLTPTECERLQGFPDGWTDIDGAKDSHRYKQMGNALAVPVATWVLDRIVAHA